MRQGKGPSGSAAMGWIFLVVGLALILTAAFMDFGGQADENNQVAENEIQKAYAAAMMFFAQNPKQALTMEALARNDYDPQGKMVIIIEENTFEDLKLMGWHVRGTKVYTVGRIGIITEAPRP